jgi:two-component system chemotaxis sensor kinase CheA
MATPATPAPIDLTQFHRVFFEEAAEHLSDLEHRLVQIDPESPPAEELNAIFRAAHSIKGGSGTFGFQDMASVTHAAESLLDRVRHGELALSSAIVDVILESCDVLKEQLAHHRDGADPAGTDVDTICARIRAVEAAASGAGAAESARRVSKASAPAAPSASPRPQRTLVISFPAPHDGRSSVDGLQASLAELGTLEALPAGDDGRLRWTLTTERPDQDVRALFEWSTSPEAVEIVESAPEAGDAGWGLFGEAPAAVQPTADAGWGLFDTKAAAPAGATAGGVPKPAAAAARKPAAQPDTSIRVSVDKVDQLINLVGELVITQSMLAQSASQLDPAIAERLQAGLAQFERNTRDLQEAVLAVRMMPIAVVFNRFPRVVRDLTAKLGKEVELVIEGEHTELDKSLIEKLSDPLTHLVRNSLDHGIESVEARTAAGKSAKGRITLSAAHRGGSVVIRVEDDGAGLHRERILAKARERGMEVADDMPDTDVWALIFEAGFSTAKEVTEVSGRGVGMDVVRRNIEALGGRVEIESTAGLGSSFSIRLPLTLAILDGMSVGIEGGTYILPLANVVESMRASAVARKSISGAGTVVSVRGAYLPVVSLASVFGVCERSDRADDGILVIVESDGVSAALEVDELLGQHQVVIKSLETNYRRVPGVSGATILGDGRVALILDAAQIVRRGRH